MDDLFTFIKENEPRYLDELSDLLRVPSVSAQPHHQADIQKCADMVVEHFKSFGMPVVEKHETAGNPIIYSEWCEAPGQPTLLVYGHYDVQPEDPIDEWDSPPFEPTVKDGAIYARGAADDKGQFFVHLKATEAHLKTRGTLPINVKFIIEGEEEIGGENLDAFVASNREKLRCDAVLVSDTQMYGRNMPSIVNSLRGIVCMQIDLQGPSQDLHSGIYGGVVQNPGNALSTIIAKLKDDDGRVLVPGFYDDVKEISAEQKAMIAKLPFDEKHYQSELGVSSLVGEPEYSTLERATLRPTLDVNGIKCGYQGEGTKSIVPARATAKISMRMVAGQDPEKIMSAFESYVAKIAPKGVDVKCSRFHYGQAYFAPTTSKAMQAATRALKTAFGKEPLFFGNGGSIPVVQTFKSELGIDSVLMGLGSPDEQIHSPNERFYLDHFYGGIRASAAFFEEFAKA